MLETHEALIGFIDSWVSGKPGKILVVGDYMMDRYVYGDADRLSPDAPVPVLAVKREENKAGGSANVCLDLLALKCKVSCVGVVGRDEMGKVLSEQLKDAGCYVSGLVVDGSRPTTVKQNFVGLAQHRHPQKMFRVDYESKAPLDKEVADKLLEKIEKQIVGASGVCIEDYNKGVLTPYVCKKVIAMAKKYKVPVFVDPAAIDDYSKYKGATTITPNRTEAELATGMTNEGEEGAIKIAKKLKKELSLEVVVLTLDKQGVLLLEGDEKPRVIPTVARSVYDVTGAGDMVLAMLSAAVSRGSSWGVACQLANIAAGLEVQQFGVVPIPLEDVLLAILSEQHEDLGKLRTLEQLIGEVAAHRSQGKKIAFTNGCFDILHAGHVSYLRGASKEGDLLIVGLNSDESISKIKGPSRPINHIEDRVMVLSELESVDYVVVFGESTPKKLLRGIKPDVLVKGADYAVDEVVGHEIVTAYGGRIALIDLVAGRSTTNLIAKMGDDA